MKIVRFKGKFTDLIPNGWTFQKLFARNYRQYHKTCDGSEYGRGCRIWQHLGGYLEVDDLGCDFSAILVQQIIDGKIDEWKTQFSSIFHPDKLITSYWFKIDMKDRRFYPRESEGYKRILQEENDLTDSNIKGNEDKIHEHFGRYRSWHAKPELIEMLKDLVNRGWIAVEEAPKKDFGD